MNKHERFRAFERTTVFQAAAAAAAGYSTMRTEDVSNYQTRHVVTERLRRLFIRSRPNFPHLFWAVKYSLESRIRLHSKQVGGRSEVLGLERAPPYCELPRWALFTRNSDTTFAVQKNDIAKTQLLSCILDEMLHSFSSSSRVVMCLIE
jgi:hypothetical protein